MANPEQLATLQDQINEVQKALSLLKRGGPLPPAPNQLAQQANLKLIWNEWRLNQPTEHVDLRGADLRGATLWGADLTTADLSDANLSDAELVQANCRGANLRGANLRKAQLGAADLSSATLDGADLEGATLYGADLSDTRLRGTNFNNAQLDGTIFGNVDLSASIGLEAAVHRGPSTISINTVYLSKGKIAAEFLNGTGAPDNFIEYMRSLTGPAVEFYSCFISYSTADQPFAERLFADLQAKGVRCWFAPHHIAGGKKIDEQIDEAIRLHERLLLILSRSSIESKWVKTEISKARKREVTEQRRVLFPVRLVDYDSLLDWKCSDTAGKDSAREIREYFIPDFSNWEDRNSYQPAFDRLLRDLRTDATV